MDRFGEKCRNLAERRFNAFAHHLFVAFIKIADPTRRILFASRLAVNHGGLPHQVFKLIIIIHSVRKARGSSGEIEIEVLIHGDVTLRSRPEDEFDRRSGCRDEHVDAQAIEIAALTDSKFLNFCFLIC